MITSRNKKKAVSALILALVFCFAACGNSDSQAAKHYTKSEIAEIINSDEMLSSPEISSVKLDKYPTESFLFDNECFSFWRDMDYFLGKNIRYDFLDFILDEYPPQIVRTIENHGQKCMYFVYETKDNTRVFIFFFESDNFGYTRGYPIIMKKTLTLADFDDLEVGDSLDDVEKIDQIASLYRKGYDSLSYEVAQRVYVDGSEVIATVHLLRDGIIKITYDRDESGKYTINDIRRSDEFIIPTISSFPIGGGEVCYLIYPDDYIS